VVGVTALPGEAVPNHHGSHRDLLRSVGGSALPGRAIDAIIVPTDRPPAYLAEAAALALALRCPLVTLHSGKWTSASKAAQRLPAGLDLVAIDVPDPEQLRLPRWQTSDLLAGTVFARRTDSSAKRNLALMLSHLLGWSRILFLDDDITELNPVDVRTASSLLDTHCAVGLQNFGYPDNSVVCHAYRLSGGKQQAFVGAGALAAEIQRQPSFFPDIYNEDWFFLLDGDKRLQPTAVTGRVRQYPYDPFRNPDRARAEEFGDVLAEGLFWLLDQGRSMTDADARHWAGFLRRRGRFIDDVLVMVRADNIPADEKARRVAALKGALGRLALITPGMCESYLRAWIADRQQWQRHIESLPSQLDRVTALGMLNRPGSPRLTWRPGGRAVQPSALPAAAATAAVAGAVAGQLAVRAGQAGRFPPWPLSVPYACSAGRRTRPGPATGRWPGSSAR
jgi:hypothetical protein